MIYPTAGYALGTVYGDHEWSGHDGVCRVLGPGLDVFSFAWGFLQMLPAPPGFGGMYLNQRVAFLAWPLPLITYWYVGHPEGWPPHAYLGKTGCFVGSSCRVRHCFEVRDLDS